MSLFLLLGPALFFGLLLTNGAPERRKEDLGLFLKGLATSSLALLMHYLFRDAVPLVYGSLGGVFYFWFRDFLWYSLAGFLPFAFFPSLKEGIAGRTDRMTAFALGAMAMAGLATLVQTGPPPDIYFVLYLPLLRIALILLISFTLDRALSEFGARLGFWIAASVLIGPIAALVPVFHFWNAPLGSLPILIAFLGAAYLSRFGFAGPSFRRGA